MDGIQRAYAMGYERLITMDCDFTHSPADLRRLLDASHGYDLALGSRYLERGSLPGWNPLRRFLTWFGHVLTKRLLKIEFDATGALRVYNLQTIPRGLFGMVASRGYSFFFESLFFMVRNGARVKEVPIVLPVRTYGHSKMSLREAAKSARQLLSLYASTLRNPNRFRYVEPVKEPGPKVVGSQDWEDHRQAKQRTSTVSHGVTRRRTGM
jgi:dolichol-phosphate mannosyltransferase